MAPHDLVARLGLEGELPHLEEALTHPSFSNEARQSSSAARRAPRVDNQRLEFLGDAVLGLCVSELLMERHPSADEGQLSLLRSTLVNSDALAAWARAVDLGSVLRLGRGADTAGERGQRNVLADAAEALVAAVYLDRGLDAARALAGAIVAEPLERLAGGASLGRDPKSELQERVQATGRSSPRYRVIETAGPDHDREFVVEVTVDGEVLGVGRGRSKKLAEQAAAQAALARASEPPPAPAAPPAPNPGESS